MANHEWLRDSVPGAISLLANTPQSNVIKVQPDAGRRTKEGNLRRSIGTGLPRGEQPWVTRLAQRLDLGLTIQMIVLTPFAFRY
jgi:hypothetical protein